MRKRESRHTSCTCTLVLAILLIGFVFALSACRHSPTITEVVHTQDAETVDHDSGQTYKVASEQGEARDDVVASDYSVVEGAKNKKSELVNVVYASHDADSTLPTPRYAYDAKGHYDTEASEGVGESDDGDDRELQQETVRTQGQRSSARDDVSESDSEDGDGEKRGGKGKKGSKGKGKKSSTSSDGGEKKGKKGSGKDPEEAGEAVVYDTTGDDPEIPDVEKVAACGQIAVIVQMLGGTDAATPLAAADEELLGGDFKSVFDDEGSAGILAGWRGDGSSSEDARMKEIIAAAPDTVLVFSSDYFTAKQSGKLAAKGISVTVVPKLSSATRIKVAVETVGKMLDKSSDGLSSKRAQEYVDYHDGLAKRIEGSRGYGALDKTFYDPDARKAPDMFTARKWSLVVDEWDYSASYGGTGKVKGAVSTAKSGIGLASVGYRNSPVSYYLGVAGVINNGAALETGKGSSGLLAPVWQFSTSVFDLSGIGWSSSAVSSRVYEIGSRGFTKTTLVTAGTARNDIVSNGFGSSKFPLVIVGTQKMKSAFLKGAEGNGPYHVFDTTEHDGVSFVGKTYNGTELLSTIVPGTDLSDAVAVNPHGLFSSWIEGSAESCLESAWVACEPKFESTWNGSAEQEVKEFYKDFYRYDLSAGELSGIFAGAKK